MLLEHLVKFADHWVSASELADQLGVSTRQVRHYVAAINERCDDLQLIQSGPKGYCLLGAQYFPYKEKVDAQTADTPHTRQNYIIQKLIAQRGGHNIFDFSDELFVSVPSIENDLKAVRKTLAAHNLKLARKKDHLALEGDEIDKRTLMRNYILPESYDNFILKDEIQLLTFHYRFWDLRKNIQRILAPENGIFTNDYTLNNVALHVIVMIDRIRNGGLLEQNGENIQLYEQTVQYRAAQNLAGYVAQTYGIQMSAAEIYFLMITIANNTTIVDYNNVSIGNIHQYVNQNTIDLAMRILRKVERIYYLSPFDNDFSTRFIIHINNVFNRFESGYRVRNPLKTKMKTAFPLIYDIAVFIAQEFKTESGIHFTEDEIAYIALHIGGYFENNLSNHNKATCVFVFTDYYNAYKGAVEKISRVFADTLTIKYIVSPDQYKSGAIQADFVVSSVDMDISQRHVLIQPILSDADMDAIRAHITQILQKNRLSALKTYLFNFISSSLFYKNPSFADRTDAIVSMTQNAVRLGYAQPGFTKNVLQRETLSDTAFSGVAVPHSLQDDAIQSFISFAISDRPILWGAQPVNVVVLIGVNNDTRKIFTEVFDLLINILSDAQNVRKLAAAADYKDFHLTLTTQMELQA